VYVHVTVESNLKPPTAVSTDSQRETEAMFGNIIRSAEQRRATTVEFVTGC